MGCRAVAPGGPWGSDRNSDHKLAAGLAVDHGVKVFVLAAGASAESFPDAAVKSLVNQVVAQVGQLLGVFGELKAAAVDGGGHVWFVGGGGPPLR